MNARASSLRSPPPSLVCPWRADLPASLVASPDDSFWQSLPAVDLVETVSGEPPTQRTRVWCARDATELRVLFDCGDARPWATHTERDGPLWTEEVVEVFLDPFGDGQCYFEIELNPLGTVCDLVLRRVPTGWRKDFAWHTAGLRTTARKQPGGWTGEFSIPFAALGPDLPGEREWRVNFLRVDRPGGTADSTAELSAWSPTGARNFHVRERFGFLRLSDR